MTVGFVNSPAVLTFMAQVPELRDVPRVATHNLVARVLAGSMGAVIVFAGRVDRLTGVTSTTDPDDTTVTHRITGDLFPVTDR